MGDSAFCTHSHSSLTHWFALLVVSSSLLKGIEIQAIGGEPRRAFLDLGGNFFGIGILHCDLNGGQAINCSVSGAGISCKSENYSLLHTTQEAILFQWRISLEMLMKGHGLGSSLSSSFSFLNCIELNSKWGARFDSL